MKRPLLAALLLSTAMAARTMAGEPGDRRLSIYSSDVRLIAETALSSDAQPPIAHEYVWFGELPVAQFDASAPAVRWTFSDHLGTPTLQTGADGAVVWRAEYEPYGAAQIRTGAALRQPLRFPGQEQDSAADERAYNVARWYDARRSRYSQPDAAGPSGASPFAYTNENPLRQIDPLGLWTVDMSCRGILPQINEAMRTAVFAVAHCSGLPCRVREKVRNELLNAEISCTISERSDVCGSVQRDGSSNLYLHQSSTLSTVFNKPTLCGCLPAVLLHEAAHLASIRDGHGEVLEEDRALSTQFTCIGCGLWSETFFMIPWDFDPSPPPKSRPWWRIF